MRYSIVKLDTCLGSAYDINEHCDVVGFLSFAGHHTAFLWVPDEATKMRSLGTLGGSASTAYGINEYRQVTGSASVKWYKHAFRWTEAEGMQDIGPLGEHTGAGWAINNAGTIVGEASDLSHYMRAFTWTPETGMQFFINVR